jgi:thiosulfate/3-mercaptopyruvate sulfurtransferase
VAPLALHEKVLVSQEFFKTEHAEKACEQCHGGNPAAAARAEAHVGIVRDPTEAPPFDKGNKLVCAECHEDQVKTGATSLHATLSTFSKVMRARAGDDAQNWETVVDPGRKNHCTPCHSSCGQCHVSRPNFAKGGFVNGHVFQKKPDMVNQCMACHGSRVGDEYTGDRGIGDAHLAGQGMDCMACHPGPEMHASGEGLTSRYLLPQLPKCTGCHGAEQLAKVAQHRDHAGRLQCQGCHAQDYVNCYSCHTAKDQNKVAYFVNQLETESFKIGLNYPGTGLDEKYIVVRHEPTDKEVFDFYGKGGFKSFDSVPTWKRASPHNIQRRTWRSAACNHCHGQRGVFLAATDLLEYEKGANQAVVVPDDKVPARRAEDAAASPAVSVNAAMLVSAEALHEMLAKKEPVAVVDARTPEACRQGHIEGAVLVNVMAELRYPPDATPRAMTMRSAEELAALFGGRGIGRDTRVVVYDNGGLEAQFLAFVLMRLGNANVAVLNGGLDAWAKDAKLPLVPGDPAPAPAQAFAPQVDPTASMINREVAAALQDPRALVLDVRSVAQFRGLRRHPLALGAGHLDKAVNLSVRGLWTPEGFLKGAEQIAWLLESSGVTKDRKVIVTCNTGQQAAAGWFALKYLGYPDVVLHDGSWVSWERSPMMKK